MKQNKIDTVLFDMDGTLIDTEKYYHVCWIKAAAECGFHMSNEQALELRSLGKPFMEEIIHNMFGPDADYYEIRKKRVKLMDEMIQKEGITCKPGAAEALMELRRRNYQLAVVTAASKERADEYLSKAGLNGQFDEIICATMVERGKPAPDVYLHACKKLGKNPIQTMAVEDSPNGVKSAYRAGCNVVMVPDQTQPDEELMNILYAKVDSLADLPLMLQEAD